MPLTTAPRTRLGLHATPTRPWGTFTGRTEQASVEICDDVDLACVFPSEGVLAFSIEPDPTLAMAIPNDHTLNLRC